MNFSVIVSRHICIPRIYPLISLLIFLSFACSLPGLTKTPVTTTAEIPIEPTAPIPATPQPLPPKVIETEPLSGERLALDGTIQLIFNQPMERESVQNALSVEPSFESEYHWKDDRTLLVIPKSKLAPKTRVQLRLETTARAQNALALTEPFIVDYQTADLLRVTQQIPENGSMDIYAKTQIVATFNQPVVPLGSNADTLPPAFSLLSEDGTTPEGVSEWLNTSTFVFTPQPALSGGKTYQVILNPQLTSIHGAPLQAQGEWTFHVAPPTIINITPNDGEQRVRLDSAVVITFNQPMDKTSVENQFALLDSTGKIVDGTVKWNEDGTQFTFHPAKLLNRNQEYTAKLSSQTQAAGGVTLSSGIEAHWRTVPDFSVTSTQPVQGGQKDQYASINLFLSSPIDQQQLERFIKILPEVNNLSVWWDSQAWALTINGPFEPSTDYVLEVSTDLTDVWGSKFTSPFRLKFRTASLPPNIVITSYSDAIFLTTQDKSLPAQAVNIPRVTLASGSISLPDWFMLLSMNGYEFRQSFKAGDHQVWEQPLEQPSNRSELVQLNLQPNGEPRKPGLYYLEYILPEQNQFRNLYLLVISDVNLTVKLSRNEVFVWAVDLNTLSPLANQPIVVYGSEGQQIASGNTDAQGIFRESIPTIDQAYDNIYVISGSPGEANFGLGMARWNAGVSSWDFSLRTDIAPNPLKVYLYTDRPIYRPGQTVFFKGFVRNVDDGRYSKASLDNNQLDFLMTDSYGQEVSRFSLKLSPFGGVDGEYSLPANAQPGAYCLKALKAEEQMICFEVAAYRKPEIDLEVTFTQGQVLSGENAQALINARYFFGAPAGQLDFKWTLYAADGWMDLDGFTTSEIQFDEFFGNPYPMWGNLGRWVAEGEAQTDAQGKFTLNLPTEKSSRPLIYHLEVTATDESGFPVSKRASFNAYPARYIVGVKSDQWMGRAGDAVNFDVITANWDGKGIQQTGLRAEFSSITWSFDDKQLDDFGNPKLITQTELVASTDFSTAQNGLARLEFIPPKAGTYLLTVSGGEARTSLLVWVSGEGSAIFPGLPNQRLELVADKPLYSSGESAKVLITNPFPENALALITVERGNVRRYETMRLTGGSTTYTVPLKDEDVPNVYLSVTLIGSGENGQVEFRQGYLNLPMKVEKQALQVKLISKPEQASPGEEVTFEIQVLDSQNQPVQGEFSLAVVDKAIFELAETNTSPILETFYGIQPLGVQTGLTLAVAASRMFNIPGGLGGGGGEAPVSVARENFPDTAYWSGKVITDAQGIATVNVKLPDNLTTWVVTLRGLSEDTRVGEAEVELVSTKDLIIRPALSRFWVVGDHLPLAVVLQNNTSQPLEAKITLQASGFILDEGQLPEQTITLPANGRVRVEWWGKADSVPSADILITARSGALQDSIRIAGGKFPILQYLAPQAFSTSGVIEMGGEMTEAVSLPPSASTTAGSLRLELTPSLGGIILDGIKAVKDEELYSTDQALSHLLVNQAVVDLLKTNQIPKPDIETELKQEIEEEKQFLLASQKQDGSWSWRTSGESDPLITAYVLFGLQKVSAPEERLQKAKEYLLSGLVSPADVNEPASLSRLAFIHFVLSQSGTADAGALKALYDKRDQLSPWAQALLALALETTEPGSAEAQSLFSEVEGRAVRTSSGVHWEEDTPSWRMSSYQLTVTAMTLYALAGRDANAQLITDAVRYLVSNRRVDGSWGSSFSTAWALMALHKVMSGRNEGESSFDFSAKLNGAPVADGSAKENRFTSQVGEVSIEKLFADMPNALTIQRGEGQGNLYYRSILTVYQPPESAKPIQRGIVVSRRYQALNDTCKKENCPSLSEAPAGSRITARVTITLENDAYYLVIKDAIPAGSELLDRGLDTSQIGLTEEEISPSPTYQFSFERGLGWMYFSNPLIFDDHILWTADYLPAGTYELTYTLTLLQPGEYHVLPAQAWEYYFPEVQGTSAGTIFTILK